MELARVFDGKKFMWDGRTYGNEEEAKEASQSYQNDGFEVELIEQEEQWFLFTRRMVKEVVVEGQSA